MLKRLLMPLMLILLFPQFMRAQDVAVYPIDVNAIITPPHGTCLKDYVGSRRFMVNVLLRDMTKRPDDFVVEMSVKNAGGRVVFRSYFGNLSLHPGKPAYLDSEIQNGFISQLFNENNISIGGGYATKCFEEGAYTISFQAFSAYHYPQRRIALSRASATTLFMQSTVQGPYLIYPYNKDSIACSETVINFQWQSANPTGEPLSYQLQVAEVPEGVSANRAFEQNSVLVEDVQNLYHSIYQSVKTEGKYKENTTYAWRVLVNKLSGESHISPVYTFVYCGTPQVPEPEIPYDPVLSSKRMDYSLDSLHIDSVDTVSITPLAYWKNKPEIAGKGYCGIGIEVRKQGQDKWTPYIINTVDTTKFQLSNLSYGTLYEIRGQYIKCGEQDTLYGPYGDTLQFIIPDPNRAADCGDDIPPLTDCGDSKGKIMRVGDTINANGTSVIIDSLSYDEKDSTIITGKGHIEFPIIKNIRLWTKFEKIQINCAGELAKGNIVSIYDPRTAAMIDLEELTGENSTGGGDNPVANSTTEAYSKEKFDAAPAGSFFTKGDTVVMKDGSGNEVIIGREISLSSNEYASRNALVDDAHFLEFRNDIDPDNVAFDNDKDNIYSRIDQGKEGYQKFSNAGGRNYIIPWLANNPGKLKPLSVKDINLKGGSLFDSVKFVMPTNGKYIELSCETTGEGEYKIRIPGGAGTRNSFEVYALGKMKGNSSYQDAGKLLIANYAPRTQKVIFVPVTINDDDWLDLPEIDLDSIRKGLDAIYGKLGISFELSEDGYWEQENIEFLLEDGLDLERKGKWDILSDEMEYIKYLYSMEHKVEHGAAYIFFLNKRHASDVSVVGDMPRGQASGFMFVDENLELFADARLVAHELGHGLYSLQHTFDYPALENVETDNLMDYNGGDFLAHFQWRLIQNPTLVWSFLQDDEDGQKRWKNVVRYVLQIGADNDNDNDIVWVIDGTSYETLKSKVANDCLPEVVEEKVDRVYYDKQCKCECEQGEPEILNVYYFDGIYRCFINRGKIKEGEIKRKTSLSLDKDTLDVNGTHLDACTHIYIRNKKCIQKNSITGNELLTIKCKTDTLELCRFNVRPCYSFVECKVGNETIYLKPNSSGTSEITTNSDSICLYPLFINENVLNASKINDRCKLKIEDYPYLLKEIKFNYDSKGSGFIKSFDNSRALLKEKKERQLDIPSMFKLEEERKNTYSVNGMEVKINKTKEMPYVSAVRCEDDKSHKYYISENYATDEKVPVSTVLYRKFEELSDFKFNLTNRKEDAEGVWGKTCRNHYLTYSVVQKENEEILVKEANLYSDINLSSFKEKDVLIKSDTEEKGKVVFKKIEGDVIKPKLNIVIVNDMKHPAIDDYDKMIKDLNKIYYVSGIEWSLNPTIINIEINIDFDLKDNKGEAENVKKIMNRVKPKATEYYMIVYPKGLVNGAYGFTIRKDGETTSNYFAISSDTIAQDSEANYNIVIQCIAHELGHCAGLEEFAIYRGVKTNYEESPMTKNTTNVMGYNQGYQLDFNEDQVEKMRENVIRVIPNQNK